jgi:rhomboid protease GluP
LCRNCGAIVGAGQAQCAVCGTPTAPQAQQVPGVGPPDRETVRFARAVLSRPYIFTVILLVANLFVFMLMWQSSGMNSQVLWAAFPEPVLIAYGAKLNYLINAPHHQWWRFITPVFVHINLPHLLVNMYSLWIVGPYVEKLYGSAKFIVFWVVTGAAGVVASYLTVRPELASGILGKFIFRTIDGPSAGASGALFGLVGVLFVFGIKFRRELPEGFKRAFGTGMLPIIVINLAIGYIARGLIDNAAHLGGLLSGAALATVVQYRRPGERRGVATAWRVLQLLAVLVVAVSFVGAAKNFRRSLDIAAHTGPNATPQDFFVYVSAMTQLQEKTVAVIQNYDVSNLETVSQKAMQAPAPDAKAAELRNRLLVILSQLTAATPTPGSTGPRKPPMDQKAIEEFQQWRKEYDEWMKGALQIHTSPPQ